MLKSIRYTFDAMRDLGRYAAGAKRVRKALQRYADGGKADVVMMRDGSGKRLRAGDYRAIFHETDEDILVTKVRPRGIAYDD